MEFKKIKILVLMIGGLFISMVSGCASNPSFEKDSRAMLEVLRDKDVSCNSISQLTFKPINLPYKTSTFFASSYEMITEKSQVFEFNGEKSYVIAYELPERSNILNLQFASVKTWNYVYKGGFFSPVIGLYDDKFQEISTHSDFQYTASKENDFSILGGIQGDISLPINAKYILIYSNSSEWNKSSSYQWDGSRPSDIDSAAVPKLLVSGEPDFGASIITRPNIPEGQLAISIK